MKKENEVIKDRIIRDIRTFFEHEEKDYYKPVRVGNIWGNNYIEYESNGDGNKTLSIEEYLSKNRPYLRPYIRPHIDIINDLKKSDTWNIKLTIAIKGIV